MAVPSYGLIVDPKYIYFSESAQRALQHITNCASGLGERPHLGVNQTFAKVFSKVAVVWRKPESCRKLRVGRRDGDHFSTFFLSADRPVRRGAQFRRKMTCQGQKSLESRQVRVSLTLTCCPDAAFYHLPPRKRSIFYERFERARENCSFGVILSRKFRKKLWCCGAKE